MKNQVYFGILWRIFLFFIVAMALTFVPDNLRSFFGDSPMKQVTVDQGQYGKDIRYEYCGEIEYHADTLDVQWCWGVRHYWYFWMMVCLAVLSAMNIFVGIGSLIDRHYPNFKP